MYKIKLILLYILSIYQLGLVAKEAFYLTETRLKNDLLKNYDKGVIPLTEEGKPIIVSMGLSFVTLDELDKKGEFAGIFFFNMNWKDERLTWNSSDYNGLNITTGFLHTEIWIPDIFLYNGEAEIVDSITGRIQPIIESNGNTLWVPPIEIKTKCYKASSSDLEELGITNLDVNITTTTTTTTNSSNNTIDKNNKTSQREVKNDWICVFKFGSWVYDESKIHVGLTNNSKANGIEISSYRQDPKWQITQNTASETNKTYPCCPNAYGSVNFVLRLNKKV